MVLNRPSVELLDSIYASTGPDPYASVSAASLEADADARELATWISRHGAPLGPMLDVGCGGGAFSYHLAKLGYGPAFMLDPDPRAGRGASCVPDSRFMAGRFEDAAIKPSFLTVIVMSQVLEHALDPQAWLGRASLLLKPGGMLVVALPNFAGVYRLLGPRDPFLIPPQHLNYFTADSLSRMLENADFQVRRITSRSRITLQAPGRRLSASQRVMRSAWNNLAAPLLNMGTRGVMLWAIAERRRSDIAADRKSKNQALSRSTTR